MYKGLPEYTPPGYTRLRSVANLRAASTPIPSLEAEPLYLATAAKRERQRKKSQEKLQEHYCSTATLAQTVCTKPPHTRHLGEQEHPPNLLPHLQVQLHLDSEAFWTSQIQCSLTEYPKRLTLGYVTPLGHSRILLGPIGGISKVLTLAHTLA